MRYALRRSVDRLIAMIPECPRWHVDRFFSNLALGRVLYAQMIILAEQRGPPNYRSGNALALLG
jgi:hypothetical protein